MTGGKQPIMYGDLRHRAVALRTQEHRKRFNMLNPNTARGDNTSRTRTTGPSISPIKQSTKSQKYASKYKLSATGEKRWRQMNAAFIHEDVQRSGIISHSIFVKLLSNFKLKIDSNELIRLETRYGKDNGISYPLFMKHMRKMMSDRKAVVGTGNGSSARSSGRGSGKQKRTQEEEATSFLLDLITRQWRQLQYSFSQHDLKKNGKLDMKTVMSIMNKAGGSSFSGLIRKFEVWVETSCVHIFQQKTLTFFFSFTVSPSPHFLQLF